MSMLTWVRNEKKANLILFVHGLKGGIDTWSYSDDVSFPSLILADTKFSEEYDIACFNYFTTFTETYGKIKSFYLKVFKSLSTKKNLPIQEIAELLNAEIKINLSQYDNIIIIAHSMGGLVAKACILKQLNEDQISPVKFFISLAVPHSGAKIANIGELVSTNVQLKDLSVLSDAIDQFTRQWIEAESKPKCKYIYAANDAYVDKKSALAIGSSKQDSLAVDEDHFSICKPKDNKQTIYNAVTKYIEDFCRQETKAVIESFVDENQYDDEFFVLKMVLADIHADIHWHAKEYFFNAELSRKIFTSDHDRKALDTLYKKIKHLYQEEYEAYISQNKSSDSFIASVHARIMNEDNSYLNFVIGGLDGIHKKGMLHQIANKNDRVIVWSKDTSLDTLNKLKEEHK